MDISLTGSDFAQVRAFMAVAETLSFSRAAGALEVTLSALSQTVRAFEAKIGVRLFNRTTRSVSLTDAGENLFRRVRPAVAELDEAIGQVRRYQEQPSGLVRVIAFRSAADLYITPMLADFHRAYPEVVVDLCVDDAVVDLVTADFDLALRIGEVIERDLVAVRLGPDLRQVAVASPDYPARNGRPEHPRELVHHPCIRWRWRWPGQVAPYSWEFFESGAWFEVAVQGPLIVNSKDLVIQAALDGMGIAFAVEQQVVGELADGRLVALLEAWSAPFPGHHLCYPSQKQMAPAIRVFIDALRRQAT